MRTTYTGVLIACISGLTAIAAEKEAPNIVSPASADTEPSGETSLGRQAIAEELLARALTGKDFSLALAALKLANGSMLPDDLGKFVEVARDLAHSEDMLVLIERITRSKTRGSVVQDPLAVTGTVPGLETTEVSETPHLVFRALERAEVYLAGDGSTDLDLVVRDEFGIEICRSESSSDREYCAWVPRKTGAFTVEIVNHGGTKNSFNVRTN